jgi:TonB family protein
MRRIMLLLMFVVSLPLMVRSQTTAASSTVDPAIADLAGRLSASLHKAGTRRVVVLNLRGPQKESHPVGTWLADQLSSALQGSTAVLEIVDRAEIKGCAETHENSSDSGASGKKLVETGRAVGADAVVTESFAKIAQRLGITLLITNLSRSGPLIPSVRGAAPISEEIVGLSPEPIPSFKGDVLQAGIGGISTPICIRCPNPDYSDKARKAKYQGTVVLEVVVTADGRVENPIVVRGPGLGLEENSIRAVKRWRFKPAEDLDNKPVTARVPIEVSFRFY